MDSERHLRACFWVRRSVVDLASFRAHALLMQNEAHYLSALVRDEADAHWMIQYPEPLPFDLDNSEHPMQRWCPRLPFDVIKLIHHRARLLGYTLSGYVSRVIAQDHANKLLEKTGVFSLDTGAYAV